MTLAGRVFLGALKTMMITAAAVAVGGTFWVLAQMLAIQPYIVLTVTAVWLAAGALRLLRNADTSPPEPVYEQDEGTPVSNWRQAGKRQ